MPKKEWTPEEREAHAEKSREAHARRRREAAEAEAEARKQRWAKPARPEGIETVSEPKPGVDFPNIVTAHEAAQMVEEAEEMALTQEHRPEPEPEPAEPTPTTPFEIYLSMLPPETRELLDDEELRKAFDDAEREAKQERKKQLAQQARDRAKEVAREAAGLLTPEEAEKKRVRERMTRRVKVTPSLPFVSDTGGVVAQGVSIDGVLYQHGQQATMPMGRALDIRHMLYCLQQNELEFEGKGRRHALRQQYIESNNIVKI